MLYVILGEDHENTLALRLEHRPRHLERLQTLLQEGRLLLAGPLPAIDSIDPGPAGFNGSLIVAEFPTLAEAQAWAEADPYIEAGVYRRVTVRPFRKSLP